MHRCKTLCNAEVDECPKPPNTNVQISKTRTYYRWWTNWRLQRASTDRGSKEGGRQMRVSCLRYRKKQQRFLTSTTLRSTSVSALRVRSFYGSLANKLLTGASMTLGNWEAYWWEYKISVGFAAENWFQLLCNLITIVSGSKSDFESPRQKRKALTALCRQRR